MISYDWATFRVPIGKIKIMMNKIDAQDILYVFTSQTRGYMLLFYYIILFFNEVLYLTPICNINQAGRSTCKSSSKNRMNVFMVAKSHLRNKFYWLTV